MNKFKHKSFGFKFVIGVIVGSLFEYFGSLFQEYIFGTSTWNYSSFNFNIGGRIYLPYCLGWGIISVIIINYFYPWFKKVIEKLSHKTFFAFTVLVGIFMIFNITITTLATIRYAQRINDIKNENMVFKMIDELYPNEYINKKFPKLRVIKK